jgi:hypothetical protein
VARAVTIPFARRRRRRATHHFDCAIVVGGPSDDQLLPVAKQIFLPAGGRDEARLDDARESRPYDVFISYSRKQSKEADQFVRVFEGLNSRSRICSA